MANDHTSTIIDGILRLTATGGVLAVGAVAPNALQLLDKPLQKFVKQLDKKAQVRETQRLIRYMKRQGLVRGDYEYGLQITEKGRKRLKSKAASIKNIQISRPKKWDRKWRIVFYDIPETYRTGRNALSSKLQTLGFWQLQRSVWIYPYPCREEVEIVCQHYGIDRFVTYLESGYLDNQKELIKKFKQRNLM